MTAALIGVEFVDAPPPMRAHGAPARPAAGRRPPALATPAGYVAPDSHRPHGTHAKRAVEHCKCAACRSASRDYENRRQRALRRPDEVWLPYVPAGPARRHIEHLREDGIGMKTIAAMSGVAHGALSKLVYGDPPRRRGPSKRIRPATAAKILAVTPAHAAGAQKIDAAATWRLLDDLVARGWTKTWIGQQITNPDARSLQIGRTSVRASTARAVEALHARLDGSTGPGRRSRWDSPR